MAKSPEAFRTISEVAEWLDTPAHVLRFWESRFSQIRPVKRAGGRRYYRPSDMRLLWGIRKLLHEDGITIRGVQKILRERGVRYVTDPSPEICEASKPGGAAQPGQGARRRAGAPEPGPVAEDVSPAPAETGDADADAPAPPQPVPESGEPPAPVPASQDPADDAPLPLSPPFAPRIRPALARLAVLPMGERAELGRLAARLRALRARMRAEPGGE